MSRAASPSQAALSVEAQRTMNCGISGSESASERKQSAGWNRFNSVIAAGLERACQLQAGCPARLGDAIRYALLADGKRLRPTLVILAANACVSAGQKTFFSAADADSQTGQRESELMSAAVAVEMIHAYSLIHDDLPAMDDDDLRRGRPTVHIKFDEATAILAGDALQAMAFEQLARGIEEPQIAREALLMLAVAAGPCGLVGGQSDDLAAETMEFDLPTEPSDRLQHSGTDWTAFLQSIHRRKTGALFDTAIGLGCLIGRGDETTRKHLHAYSAATGLAFQVIDDYLDATSDAKLLGKRAGKDLQAGKLTYVRLLGVEGTYERAAELVAEAQSHLVELPGDTQPLSELADFVLRRAR